MKSVNLNLLAVETLILWSIYACLLSCKFEIFKDFPSLLRMSDDGTQTKREKEMRNNAISTITFSLHRVQSWKSGQTLHWPIFWEKFFLQELSTQRFFRSPCCSLHLLWHNCHISREEREQVGWCFKTRWKFMEKSRHLHTLGEMLSCNFWWFSLLSKFED